MPRICFINSVWLNSYNVYLNEKCRYLIGVMNMKQRSGICFSLLAIAVIIFAAVFFKPAQNRESENQTEYATENPATDIKTNEMTARESSHVLLPEEAAQKTVPDSAELYVLLPDGDRLTVYFSDRKTMYFQTDIQLGQLPQNLRDRVEQEGIPFESEEALYDFLESYSS